MKHEIEWLTPAPLWDLSLADGDRTRFKAPALLRFSSESFMDEINGVLASDPSEIQTRVARPETWEEPAAGWAESGDDSLARALKLFQPGQNRFYLVASSLVCRRTGLPERKVDVAAEEKASMVVRRLVPIEGVSFSPADPTSYTEHAWIGDREAGRWQQAEPRAQVLDGEERLPLFAMSYRHEGLDRRLHAGSVPVSGRELYESNPPAGPVTPLDSENDPFLELEDPRKAAWLDGPGEGLDLYALTKDPGVVNDGLKEMSDEDARELLTFTLLDAADFFQFEMSALWDAFEDGSSAGLDPATTLVYIAFDQHLEPGYPWRQALVRAAEQRAVLYGEEDADPGVAPPVPDTLSRQEIATATAALTQALLVVTPDFDRPHGRVFDALDGIEPSGETPPGGALVDVAEAAAASAGDGSFYAVRFVYERPRCKSFSDAVVGPLSRPFRLAAFYDPEAPARPVTIRMPVDTSIRGLSRFPKSVGMVLSNKLRQQVERVQNASLEDVDKGNVGDEPSWGIGMICSFSIPIISICALIVLMIFIQLLNIVFWWIPFLRICLPIPVRND